MKYVTKKCKIKVLARKAVSDLHVCICVLLGLSNPTLVRLDVESKLSDQLKVNTTKSISFYLSFQLSFFTVREDDKPGTVD